MLYIPNTPMASLHASASPNTLVPAPEPIDVVIYGDGNKFHGAVMLGLTPAISGGDGTTPEMALRKLFLAVTETLKLFIPKVGIHQRNIHGGGVFDDDLITKDIKAAHDKSPP